MRISRCIPFLLLAGFLCGCDTVVSVHPLYTEAEEANAHHEPRLEGEWVMANYNLNADHGAEPQSAVRAQIKKPEAPYEAYKVNFRWKEEPTDAEEISVLYDVRLVPLKEGLFFDATFVERLEKGRKIDQSDAPNMAAIPGHLVGQVWIEPEFVRFANLDSGWTADHWPPPNMERLSVDKFSDIVVLLNSTQELRDLLVQNARSEEAFRAALYLCRAGVDCTKLSVEDGLARTPDGAGALDDGEVFFAKRGDFPRAIVLQRHEMELVKPQNEAMAGQQQYELAKLLLLNREFANARGVLKDNKAPPPFGWPSSSELIVRSYFLEGDYASAVKAAKAIHSPEELTTADSIILAYFALHRLGRAKDAESFLREQTATFQGAPEEHLFLLQLAGRLTTVEHRKDLDRDRYYSALSAVQAGKTTNAVTLLQEQIAAGAKDNLLSLAAQIELQRLTKSSPK